MSISQRTAAAALFLCIVPALPASSQNADESGGPASVVDDADRDVDDVLVVTAERLEEATPVLMNEVLSANGKGGWLYRNGRYKEAFPYLLAAAKHGFKLAQARVSYIYQQGLGEVERDAEAAIGWLGVAAAPTTTPEIRNYYQRVLAHYPEQHHGWIDEIVADYRKKYGQEATRVDCDNDRLAGTHISRLKCDFRDAPKYRDVLDSEDLPQFAPPIESGP